jgi:hypothetical protein
MTAFALKLDTLYAACLPGVGLVCHGQCEDEALNNLTDELRQREAIERVTRKERTNNAHR